MPDTTTRPTPKELGDKITSRYAGPTDATDVLLADLAAHGYVIVHPDELRPQIERVILAALDWSDAGGCAPDQNDFDDIIAASDPAVGRAR